MLTVSFWSATNIFVRLSPNNDNGSTTAHRTSFKLVSYLNYCIFIELNYNLFKTSALFRGAWMADRLVRKRPEEQHYLKANCNSVLWWAMICHKRESAMNKMKLKGRLTEDSCRTEIVWLQLLVGKTGTPDGCQVWELFGKCVHSGYYTQNLLNEKMKERTWITR